MFATGIGIAFVGGLLAMHVNDADAQITMGRTRPRPNEALAPTGATGERARRKRRPRIIDREARRRSHPRDDLSGLRCKDERVARYAASEPSRVAVDWGTMTMTTTTDETIEVYWRPGCTSCLRTKEFVENTGLSFVEINIETAPERVAKLGALGLSVPCVVVGDRGVHGLDLAGVAELIGYDYEPPAILPAAELHDRFLVISTTLSRLVGQVPSESLEYKSPDRDRPLSVLGWHAGSIMRSFLDAYRDDAYDRSSERPDPSLRPSVTELVGRIDATRAMFIEWWNTLGFDDPLDRVIKTEWGYRTLHEILERCTWHVAQHTRQMAMFLERIGVAPDRPLTEETLAGLPLPEGIHSGIDA